MNVLFNPEIRMTTCMAATLSVWRHPNLSAPYWRLYWNRNAGGVVLLNGHRTPLGPGQLVLIAPNTPFASHNSTAIQHLYLHFIAPPPYTELPPSIFSIPVDPATRQRAEALFRLSTSGSIRTPRANMLALSLISQALAQVPDDRLNRGHYHLCILDAMRAMKESPRLPPSNTALALAARMNTNAFIRLFKRQAGVTPHAYGTAKRVEQACLLLHHSAIGIKEIAERTGFCDRYHFTRVFTRLRRISPAAFRKQSPLNLR